MHQAIDQKDYMIATQCQNPSGLWQNVIRPEPIMSTTEFDAAEVSAHDIGVDVGHEVRLVLVEEHTGEAVRCRYITAT